jgi:positive regulator of sigma E activity
MAFMVGIVGAIVGFAVGIVFTEVIFANNADWPTVVPFVLAVVGWLAARELVRKRQSRKPGHRVSSASR